MIYLIRHGQTELNNSQVLQGRSDWPLNENGRLQAQEAGERLRGVSFSRVYSSPLKRAVQTAAIIAPALAPVIDERLIEMDYGPYEGMALNALTPEVISFFRDFVNHPAPDGMEPLANVVKRAGEFLEARCRTDVNILVSTHAIAMKGMLEYLTPESHGGYWSKYIGNCTVYVTEYREGQFSVPREIGP
ncbi:MAG: histidine phosphatase family protein [Oscillospiraceae bacterium]|nr:histidine phosphatase family protein [Oscillospiraceae bacterium]